MHQLSAVVHFVPVGVQQADYSLKSKKNDIYSPIRVMKKATCYYSVQAHERQLQKQDICTQTAEMFRPRPKRYPPINAL